MTKLYLFTIIAAFAVCQSARSQAITGIITDYNGYWKSAASAINPVKPDNSHNLLAFSYNGTTYSTGVNDLLLTSKGETFIPNDFWSLPVNNISGAVTSNTKAGFGEKYDGVSNGASNPPPAYDIAGYLTDGIKGLNLGTCIANLPAGYMTFAVSNITPSSIGDGIPDILVTQVADPSGSFDRYSFTDVNGAMVGNYKDIIFTSITPVGNWTADFYEAVSSPLVLTGGYTKTDRALRLWAADLSEFGITASNYQTVRNFKIGLSGVSDVAFVGYSTRSFAVSKVLPVTLADFTAKKINTGVQLKWITESESNSSRYIIEKSADSHSFLAIDSIKAAGNSNSTRIYSYTDNQLANSIVYYRLKTVDIDGRFTYSNIVSIAAVTKTNFIVQPNPAAAGSQVTIQHEAALGTETLSIYNQAGIALVQQAVARGNHQTKIDLQHFTKGIYYIVWQNGTDKKTQKLLID